MEKGKSLSSSSSFTNDLFGPKEPTKTSLFNSVFGPHSTGLGRDSTHSATRGSSRIQDPKDQSCGNAKYGNSDNNGSQRSRGDISNKDKNNSILYQNETTEPCHLSSSIYYGGQDVYYPPTASHNNTFKKNEDDDDQNGNNSNCASRGNWWQVHKEPFDDKTATAQGPVDIEARVSFVLIQLALAVSVSAIELHQEVNPRTMESVFEVAWT
ncbi:putative ras-related protein RABA2b-like [Capsicum annuum]|nr:putative ras-related protein RABA2b-like [Capsicum annuum]